MTGPMVNDNEMDDIDAALEPVAAAEVDFHEPLDEDDARTLTETIRSAVDMVWVLISRAHAGQAWAALGYSSWAEYVEKEFDMSRSRSYQLLDQARVVHEIEASVPDGTVVSLSEAAARDLKGVLDEVLPEIKERTEGLEPEEARDVLDEIVDEQRERLREERDAQYADADLDDEYFADLEGEYYDGGGAGSGSGGGKPGSGGALTDEDDRPGPVYDDINDVDVVAIRRAVNAAHDLYSSLSALSGLPAELSEVIDIIPRERYSQIDGNLAQASENLAKFAELWHARQDTTGDDESFGDESFDDDDF